MNSKKRIVLVHPAGYNWLPGKKDVTTAANRMVPIGLLSIAACLEQRGHEVFVHDCLGPKAEAGTERNAQLVLDTKPDFACFSTTTSGFLDASDQAACIKERDPGIVTVFGGVHVSALEGELLKDFPHIDYLVPGEGEVPLAELVGGAEPESIGGLIFRRDGEIVTNERKKMIENLDSLPFPAYEKLQGFPRGYNLPLFSYIKFPGATMITSRGCPYKCSYCDRSVFRRGFRYNSAEYIYGHMEYLKKRFRVGHINIYDDLFTMNRKRIADLCGMLTSRPLDMNFNCAVRVGHTDDELLAMLKEAGCLQVSLGIESADEGMLERHKAGVTLDEVRDTVERIQSCGLRAKGLFMMGLPGETEKSIQATSDFVISLGLDDMNMAKFTPFPGAPIWGDIGKEGSFVNDWRQMNCLNFVFVPKGIESRERLDYLYNKHVKRFYTDREWRRKFKRRIWEHRRSIWHAIKNLPALLSAKRAFEPVESSPGE